MSDEFKLLSTFALKLENVEFLYKKCLSVLLSHYFQRIYSAFWRKTE